MIIGLWLKIVDRTSQRHHKKYYAVTIFQQFKIIVDPNRIITINNENPFCNNIIGIKKLILHCIHFNKVSA